jgi:hypothetical protein
MPLNTQIYLITKAWEIGMHIICQTAVRITRTLNKAETIVGDSV